VRGRLVTISALRRDLIHRRLSGRPLRSIPPILLIVLGMALLACSDRGPQAERAVPAEPLRAIVSPGHMSFLPRRGEPVNRDRQVVEGLAAWLGRELDPKTMRDPERMIDRLLAGDADVIAAGMAVTEARSARVAFSLPYLHVDDLLVAPKRRWSGELAGREVCVARRTGPAESLAALADAHPGLAIRELQPDVRPERLMLLVGYGACDAAALDSEAWAAVSRDFPEIVPVRTLHADRPVAVALRPGDEALRRRVNAFLTEEALTGREAGVATDDLPGIERRRTLRMLTRNNAMTYFIHRGEQLGFEYEMLRRFADGQGLRLEIVIPPSHDDLIPWLREGRGDVIAAAMTVTPERDRRVAFTRPYLEVEELVVTRPDAPVERLADLSGRTVHVRRSSAFYPRLLVLQEGIGFTIEPAPEDMETEEILARVEAGTWDVAVADSNLLDAVRRLGSELDASYSLGTGHLAWAVREGNPRLRAALDRFLGEHRRSRFFNVLRRKYFENERMLARGRGEWRSDRSGRISPWDETIREAAAAQSLDWRLVAAVMYIESGFDPSTRSWAGAVGLMQLMPTTAHALGLRDLRDPTGSIRAGTAYLRHLVDRFEPDLPLAARLRFALAAYNVGYEHVRDARRLAARMGWSPDRWQGNVARAIALLERPEYHRDARYGYCRGSAAVAYVRNVEQLYRVYAEIVPREPEGFPEEAPEEATAGTEEAATAADASSEAAAPTTTGG